MKWNPLKEAGRQGDTETGTGGQLLLIRITVSVSCLLLCVTAVPVTTVTTCPCHLQMFIRENGPSLSGELHQRLPHARGY